MSAAAEIEEQHFLREMEMLFMTEPEIEADRLFRAGQQAEHAVVQALKLQVPQLVETDSWPLLPSDLRYKVLEAYVNDGAEQLATSSEMGHGNSAFARQSSLSQASSASLKQLVMSQSNGTASRHMSQANGTASKHMGQSNSKSPKPLRMDQLASAISGIQQTTAIQGAPKQQKRDVEKKEISLSVSLASQRYFYNTIYRQIKTSGKSYRRQIKLHNTGTACLAYRIHCSTNNSNFMSTPPCGFLMPNFEVMAEVKFHELSNQAFVLFEAAGDRKRITECFQMGECMIINLVL